MKRTIALLLILFTLTATLTGCRFSIFPVQGPDLPYEGTDAEPPEYTDEPYTPALWRVTDDRGHELYLFGTIHCGDSRNEDVLETLTPILNQCDSLAVEFDVVAFENDMQAQIELLTPFVLPDGETIEDYMPADTYRSACDLMEDAGFSTSQLVSYDLAMWSDLVENALIELSYLDYDYGMDGLLIKRAYSMGIRVLDVESAKFQYELSGSFDDELYLLLIEDNLKYRYEYIESVEELYENWLLGLDEEMAGDEETDDEEYTQHQLDLVDDYNKKMLDDRNVGMADKAESYMAQGRTTFFAVGAAHMEGEAGIVALLTERGYTVERVDYGGYENYAPSYVTGDPDDLI